MPKKPGWGKYCILDDEDVFIEISRAKLSKYLPNIEGIFSSDSSQVVNLAKNNFNILFIIDINLGAENGIDIYNKITKISNQARVIFITGDTTVIDDEDIRETALLKGGIDFIEKPVKWHELAIKIKNHLNLMEYQFNLEEKVQERTAMLLHADRLATVGTMVSSIVHEVSSPLTFIKANQETIQIAYDKVKERITDPEIRNTFDSYIIPGISDSLKGVNQIEELLRSFRKFYKQDKTISTTDIQSIISEAKNLTVYNVKRHGIDFSVTYKTNEPIIIRCNKLEIVQAVTNIINNAVDALESSMVKTKKLTVTVEKLKSDLKMTISNNGPKIHPNIISHIFQPFFTTKSEDKGTGLGLSIAKQIVKQIGGDITVNNKELPTATVDFVISIPLFKDKPKR